ncbi:MAG: hypoxanthine phosphoribosyltransferase [Clostridia bacterium]|nr:hypoxanthine phosphoribosyltransferase [Clostridia bacterium]
MEELSKYSDRVLLTREDIDAMLKRLGEQITRDYAGKKLFLICVLKGGFVFMADLVRAIDLPLEVDFIAVSSYGSSTKTSGVVRLLKDVDKPLNDKHVLIVEDIMDSGLTLNYIKSLFEGRSPLSVKIVTAFDKPERRRVNITPDYVGAVIPDEFVVGYGLDYDGKLRNLPELSILRRDVYEG